MYRGTRRLSRTAFALHDRGRNHQAASSDRERWTLGVVLDTHVRGKIPEMALKHQAQREVKNDARLHATQFVQRKRQLQLVTHTSPADHVAAEIDLQAVCVQEPARRGLGTSAPFRNLVQNIVTALGDLRRSSSPDKSASVSYVDTALAIPRPWLEPVRDIASSLNPVTPDSREAAVGTAAAAQRAALQLLADEELTVEHPLIDVRPEWSRESVHELVLAFDSDYFRLQQTFGEVEWVTLRRWLTSAALGSADQKSLRVTWLQEAIRSVVWRTGVDQRVNSEAHSPRNDARRTSRDQARLAMLAIARWWHTRAGASHRLTLEADEHFLFLRTRPGVTVAASDTSTQGHQRQPQQSEPTAALQLVDTNALDRPVHRRSELATIEVTLKKVGLSHEFVTSDLANALMSLRDKEGTGEDVAPEVQVTARSVTHALGTSVQRVRILHTTLRHVQQLAARLERDGLHVVGGDLSVDEPYARFRAATRSRKPTSVAKAPNVAVLIQWEPNAAVQATKRNGFTRLSRKERNQGRGQADRKAGVVHEVREGLRHTAEEVEFWKAHYYRIYDAVVVPSEEGGFKVGDLWGYRYTTTLHRALDEDRIAITESIESLRHRGFINYFGPQRFSWDARKGVLPGFHLLRGEFRAAAHALVDTGEYHDFSAVDSTESRFDGTKSELLHLLRSTADGGASEDSCKDAFIDGLGLQACKRFVNEALSFLWNQAATARVVRHGPHAVLAGDVVRPRAADSSSTAIDLSTGSSEPVFVTEADVEAKRFTALDVVLPVPGAGVVLPRNETAGYMLVALRQHGVHLHPEHRVLPQFTSKGNPLGLDFLGGYRYIIERPVGLRCEFSADPLDAEEAKLRGALSRAGAAWVRRKDLSVQLKYRLPASAYPWAMLRELARSDIFSEMDFEISDPYADGKVRYDELANKDKQTHREVLRKSNRRLHHGTERMALAKIEASVFATHTKGGGALVPALTPHGRRDPMSRRR
jgi:tRNA(Glu) U13 pseudouridine synthase TruD